MALNPTAFCGQVLTLIDNPTQSSTCNISPVPRTWGSSPSLWSSAEYKFMLNTCEGSSGAGQHWGVLHNNGILCTGLHVIKNQGCTQETLNPIRFLEKMNTLCVGLCVCVFFFFLLHISSLQPQPDYKHLCLNFPEKSNQSKNYHPSQAQDDGDAHRLWRNQAGNISTTTGSPVGFPHSFVLPVSFPTCISPSFLHLLYTDGLLYPAGTKPPFPALQH